MCTEVFSTQLTITKWQYFL